MRPVSYDYLVLGLGATVNFFGVAGAPKHAFPMYTLPDAVRLKEHVLERWTAADRDPDLIDDGALNVVIVGAGPTGVESAGALAELYRQNLAKDYPDVPQDKARIVVVEAGDAVLSMFKKGLQTYAAKALEKRTVEIMLGEVVESIEPTRVRLKSGTVLNAHTLIWGAGPAGQPARVRPRARAAARQPDRGRTRPHDPRPPGGVRRGRHRVDHRHQDQERAPAARVGGAAGGRARRRDDLADPEEEEGRAVRVRDKGTMATIGRKAAVVQFRRGRSLTGTTAWLAWGTVHLALLSTGEDRAKAVVDWTWAGFTHERSGRIQVDETER